MRQLRRALRILSSLGVLLPLSVAARPAAAAPEPIRLLLQRPQNDVLRPDSPLVEDLNRADAFVASTGQPSTLDRLATRKEAFEALIEGRADVLVTPAIGAGAPELGTTWTKPLRSTDVIIVGRRGAPKPASLEALGTVHIARTGDLGPVLEAHFEGQELKVGIQAHADIEEASDLLGLIANRAMPHGVVLRDELDDFLAYRTDVEVWFVLRQVPVVWTIRADNEELLTRLDAFLSRPQTPTLGGDLDAVKARGVLRVALLNNAASYYLERDEPAGFHHDLARYLAEKIGVRLDVIVPARPGDFDALVASGRADLYVSAVLPASEAPNTAFSQPLMTADILLVQPADEPALTKPEQLAGKRIVARRSSAYWPVLESLKRRVPTLELEAGDESLETEALIDRVAKKQIPLTVANSVLYALERRQRRDVQAPLVLAAGQPLSYGVRKTAKKLFAAVDAFVAKERNGATYQRLHARYFAVEEPPVAPPIVPIVTPKRGKISPFDDLAQKYAQQYGFDWHQVVAQMFVESAFNPNAKSSAGALGLMQVMPRTGASIGYTRLTDPDDGTHAGVHYMRDMRQKFVGLPEAEQLRMAYASYNGGYGHIRDARLLAREQGLDPDRWHDNVARAVLLLQDKTYFSKAKYGYCRGREVKAYVERIEAKHTLYTKK